MIYLREKEFLFMQDSASGVDRRFGHKSQPDKKMAALYFFVLHFFVRRV
jgi:hypothetical protein